MLPALLAIRGGVVETTARRAKPPTVPPAVPDAPPARELAPA